MAKKHDWVILTAEFIAGKQTLSDFAKARGISQTTVQRKAREYEWFSKRKAHHEKLIQRIDDRAVNNKMSALDEHNARFLQDAKDVHDVLMSKLTRECDFRDLRMIVATLKDLQAIERMALGANFEINTQVSIGFEGWLNERIAAL